MPEHYTTINVEEYLKTKEVLAALRAQVQKARESLERGCADQALDILRQNRDI